MPHDFTGWIHFIAAIIALIAGSMILGTRKGNARHRVTGRIYGAAMILVCITAFMIYRVHGKLGILHFFAFNSTITLLLGMLPLYTRWFKTPIIHHLSWMYWSVIGLYCAFAAEVFTRLPYLLGIKNSFGIFYALVGVSTGLVGFVGSRFFKKKKDVWITQFVDAPAAGEPAS
ncbi:MAG: DUF2306 domain-containing protein [Nonlabens sp.]